MKAEEKADREWADVIAAKVAGEKLCPVCDYALTGEASRFVCENEKCPVTTVNLAT